MKNYELKQLIRECIVEIQFPWKKQSTTIPKEVTDMREYLIKSVGRQFSNFSIIIKPPEKRLIWSKLKTSHMWTIYNVEELDAYYDMTGTFDFSLLFDDEKKTMVLSFRYHFSKSSREKNSTTSH